MATLTTNPTLLTVTVSVSPQVWLSQFHSLKPHASVTIGIPPGGMKDAHLDFAAHHLRRAVFAALKTEIEVLNDASAQLLEKSEDTTQLAELCMKEIGDVQHHPTLKVTAQAQAPVQAVHAPGAGTVKVAVAKAPQAGGAKVAVPKAAVPKTPIFGGKAADLD